MDGIYRCKNCGSKNLHFGFFSEINKDGTEEYWICEDCDKYTIEKNNKDGSIIIEAEN